MNLPDEPWDLLRIRNDTFLQQVDYHESTPSTNELARNCGDDIETPLLVLAEQQTAGRGRGNNVWWSAPGALTCTLLVDLPQLSGESVGSLSLTVGLAIAESIERIALGADVAIKWPNDVYLQERKVCGVLIERAAGTRFAIGMGINVNNSLSAAPAELALRATSFVDELESTVSRTQLLVDVLQQLERRLQDHSRDAAAMLDAWRAYCFLTGREVTVTTPSEEVTGRCEGIDADGALLVRQAQDQRRCLAGVVTVF